MKKLILILITIVICASCSEEREFTNFNSNETIDDELNTLYNALQDSTRNRITYLYNSVKKLSITSESNLVETSSISSEEFIHFIINDLTETNISKSQLHKMFEVSDDICLNLENKYWKNIIETTSLEDANNLEEFIDIYIEIGGHDLKFVSKMLMGKNRTIQRLMIEYASTIDYLMPLNTTRVTELGSCEKELYRELLKWIRIDEVDLLMDTIASISGDIFPELVSAGIDVVEAIRIAEQYNRCRNTALV